MIPMLQYLGREAICPYPLRYDMLTKFSYNQTVNRVIKHKLDPFICNPPDLDIWQLHEIPYKEQKFNDLMSLRAEQLLNMNTNIYIMWSGGVDSTGALCSLLRQATKQDIERIYIACSTESIDEFPELWASHIVPFFKGRILSSHQHPEILCKKGIVVTGELGDQIMGCSDTFRLRKIFKNLGDEALYKPWKEIVPLAMNAIHGPNNHMVEKYEQCLAAANPPIKTAFEWFWWYKFTNKWNHVKYRMLGYDGWSDPKKYFANIHHFYDTIPFQHWSMYNPHLKLKGPVTSQKWILREYIVSYCNHQSYLNKPKVLSLGSLEKNKKIHKAININFEYMTEEEIIASINQ